MIDVDSNLKFYQKIHDFAALINRQKKQQMNVVEVIDKSSFSLSFRSLQNGRVYLLRKQLRQNLLETN